MNLFSIRSFFVKGSAALASTAVVLAVTGCGIGTLQPANSTDTVASAFRGMVHGGVNPVIGARVVIYATTSTGYGVGAALQEATQVGASAHQDTDSNGNFNFAGGFTCPAGQYAYIAAYGGNTGGNTNNPNSVLVVALGSCSSLYTGTTYNGSTVVVNEATTVAAAYALANFITVTGNSNSGYTVGIGAPATNNASSGCVSNAYYTTTLCPTTSAAGLGHAFNNATGLVNTNTGAVNSTMNNGAIIPVVEINTLANALQACVNSSGGGTDGSGAPTTITTGTGTSHDGTACGKLFAFTSYTNTGASSGTLTAAGNTLDAAKNLAKRPTGSASTFDSNCSSNSGTGTNTAVNCIFSLAPTNGYFNPGMSIAPSEWMIGVAYAKTSFSNSTTNVFTGSCGATTTGNGLLYPTSVATDINDDIVIFNGDKSTPICGNIIAISNTGTNLGVSTINTGVSSAVQMGLDAWGHAILPLKTGNGILFYQYGAGGTSDPADSSVPLVLTVSSTGGNTSSTNTTVAYKPQFVQSDNNSRIYVSAANAINTYGYITPTTLSHTAPVYTTTPTIYSSNTTSALSGNSVDLNNNDFTTKTTLVIGAASGGTNFASDTASSATSTNGQALVTDTNGNAWVVTENGTTVGTSNTIILKNPYTATSSSLSFQTPATASSPTYAFPTSTNTTSLNGGLNAGITYAIMDGNNVLWFPDLFGVATTPAYGGFLRGYDTVNSYGTPQLQGCKFWPQSTFSITAYNIGATTTTFTLSSTATVAVGAILNFSGFATSTFFNNNQATVTASSSGSVTVNSNFSQAASSGTVTEAGTTAGRIATACGSNSGDTSYPSSTPFLLYQTRGIAVDTMGNLWFTNGTQGTVSEILGIAAPTWPTYIHNGVSNKP